MRINSGLWSLIILYCLTSCQSVSHQSSSAPQKGQAQSSATPTPSKKSPPIEKVVLDDDADSDPEAYTPSFFEENDARDAEEDNTFSDSQNSLGVYEPLPRDEESTPQICEDSVYYSSWKTQFDAQWLAQNGKNYKSASKRAEALKKARADAYIQLAYPSLEDSSYDFPAVLNLQVAGWIDFFSGKGRKNFVVWLRRGQELIPKMETILEQNGLPKDLVYLAMIESGFNNRAVSIDGAVGTWQFMPYTARQYGLIINDWVDERRDPIKATYAAARYLTDLYTQFGSWHLAAGAYNCGAGCIAKKLRKYGEDSSYFDLTLQGVINQQTANYVPKILAAMIISKNPERFGFETLKSTNHFIQTQKLEVDRSISLTDLASNIGVDPVILGDLNPALRLGITPPPRALKTDTFEIDVPASKYDLATNTLDTLPDAPQNRIVQAQIKRRESLQKFANRYQLDVTSLQSANHGLRKNALLRKGQFVNVPLTLGSGQYEKLFSIKRHHTKKTLKRIAHKKYSGKGKKKIAQKHYGKRKAIVKNKISKNKLPKKPLAPLKQEAKK